MIYKDLTKEGFAPINSSTKLINDKKNSNCDKCDNCDNCDNCDKCNGTNSYNPDKYHLIIIMNFMLYLYIIFGMFLYLLCKNSIFSKNFLFIFLTHAKISAPFSENISMVFKPIPRLQPVITASLFFNIYFF